MLLIKQALCSLIPFLASFAFGEPSATIIRNSRAEGSSSFLGADTFTGDVWIDLGYSKTNETWIGHVTFTPSSRTFWHRHEGGQILEVISGSGWICDRGGQPRRLEVGDIVWCPPGTEHWHGADDDSLTVQLDAAFGGSEWLEEVTDEEYGRK